MSSVQEKNFFQIPFWLLTFVHVHSVILTISSSFLCTHLSLKQLTNSLHGIPQDSREEYNFSSNPSCSTIYQSSLSLWSKECGVKWEVKFHIRRTLVFGSRIVVIHFQDFYLFNHGLFRTISLRLLLWSSSSERTIPFTPCTLCKKRKKERRDRKVRKGKREVDM